MLYIVSKFHAIPIKGLEVIEAGKCGIKSPTPTTRRIIWLMRGTCISVTIRPMSMRLRGYVLHVQLSEHSKF
jgi:hypothetical protein